jgi:hypothetical protein
MLADGRHRAWVLKQVADELVARFWTVEFAGYGKQFAAEAVAAPLNKLGALLASPAVRAAVTKTRPRLDAAKALARGRAVVARIPKGEIGEDAAYFLGGLLIGAFQHAAIARAALPAGERKLFSVLVDEAASFAAAPLLSLLAEARKYGVGLVLATQSLSALPEATRSAVVANVGTTVAFRSGADDAELLSREFAGRVSPAALMSLDVGECAVRAGAREAFVARVPPLP